MTIEQRGGVVVNISLRGFCIDFYGASFSVARAASDHMVQAFAADLHGTGVRACSPWPFCIRTERPVMAAEGQPAGFDVPEGFDHATGANSPEMWGAAYTLSGGSILPAILIHLSVNVASNLAVFAGFREPDVWFSSSLGPYVLLAIFAIALMYFKTGQLGLKVVGGLGA